jgi:hypothetical protein
MEPAARLHLKQLDRNMKLCDVPYGINMLNHLEE